MKNKDISDFLWKRFNAKKTKNIHDLNGILVEDLIDKCFEHKCSDNLTAVLISLENMKTVYNDKSNMNDLDIDNDLPLNTVSHYTNMNKNYSLTNEINKQQKIINSHKIDSKTERNNSEKKLLLNKIIRNTLSIKSKTNTKTDHFISLNNAKC